MPDRRAYTRTNLHLPVKVRVNLHHDRELVYDCQIQDFSVEGFRVDLPGLQDLEIGRNLDFEIDTIRSRETIRAKGRLCWLRHAPGDFSGNEAGVRLVDMRSEDWNRWLHLTLDQGIVPNMALS